MSQVSQSAKLFGQALAVVVSVPSTYDTSHTKVPWESIIRATFGTIEGRQHPGDPSEYM